MFDHPPQILHQRARGRAAVGFRVADGATRLDRLHQSGSAKAMLPRVHSGRPEVVFLNTAGGLTGGDRLEYALDLAPDGTVLATTQTAERAYASAGGVARIDVTMTVGPGARLDWLPQETILFDRAALHRRTRLALAGDAALLYAEIVVLGRQAMGETVRTLDFRDRREVTRDGRPVLLEPMALDAAALARRDGPAVLGGVRAMATVALVAPGAEDALGAMRRAIGDEHAAASGWDGRCILRALADDALPLRRLVARTIGTLRGGKLPRVWQV